MEDTCFPIPTCGVRIPITIPQPQSAFLAKFLGLAKWMLIVLGVTVYLLYRLLLIVKNDKDGKPCPPSHSKDYAPDDLMVLSFLLFCVSLLSGAYLVCIYMRAELDQDPGRYCFVRFTSTLFYDTGLLSLLVVGEALFLHGLMLNTLINVTVIVGAAILVVFTIIDSLKVCAVSNNQPAAAAAAAAPEPPSSATAASTIPVGTHREWHCEWESACDYIDWPNHLVKFYLFHFTSEFW
ncbi:hypothetical protein HanLR1_Chr05g0194811 [Helianthus annuus]|nr:hypothetical protein HanLR1_Chr05g0194811 [Helianthus annuus]